MQDYQQRVLDEKSALDEKLDRLRDFSETPAFDALSSEEQIFLVRQSVAMTEYSRVLAERINMFAPDLSIKPYDGIIIPKRPR